MGAPGRAARLAVAAAASFLAGVSLAALGRWSARESRGAAELEVRRAADELGATVNATLAAAHAHAETLSESPIVRAAIAADPATAREVVRDEPTLQPRAGEELELFQSRDGKHFAPLLHASSFAPPTAPLSIVRLDHDELIVAASAPVDPLSPPNPSTGKITVAAELSLAPLRTRLAARGLSLELSSGHAPDAIRAANDARVSAAVPCDGVTLALTVTIARGGARALVLAGRVALLLALALVLAALSSLRRIRVALQPSADMPAPSDPSSLFESVVRFGPPRIETQTPPPAIAPPTIQSRAARTRATTIPYLPPRRARPSPRAATVPVADEAATTPPKAQPNTPSPVPREPTAREGPRSRHADDAPTRKLMLAWSAQDPTPITQLSPLSLPSVPLVIDARVERLDDRYRIVQLLGRGHAADVFLAQPRASGAPTVVALKLLSASLPPLELERQLAAARRQRAVTHPNVARVLDVGAAEAPFIAMEYVEGCNLERLVLGLGGELVPAAQSVAIAIALCAALCAALAAGGLCHGAVKARNVLVGRHDAIKLADFGAPPAPSDRVAPEQHAGKPVDARTDVYALGVLLHELLTGERVYPVDGRELRWPALAPPSQRRPELPRALDVVIARATRFAPRERHSDAAALGRELTRVAGSIPAQPSRLGDFVERARRS